MTYAGAEELALRSELLLLNNNCCGPGLKVRVFDPKCWWRAEEGNPAMKGLLFLSVVGLALYTLLVLTDNSLRDGEVQTAAVTQRLSSWGSDLAPTQTSKTPSAVSQLTIPQISSMRGRGLTLNKIQNETEALVESQRYRILLSRAARPSGRR